MAKEFALKFYRSRAWVKCKNSYISRVHGMCEQCDRKGILTPGYIVHHKIKLTQENINDITVTLNHDNLEYLCLECHNRVHGNGVTRDDVMFDDEGNLIAR